MIYEEEIPNDELENISKTIAKIIIRLNKIKGRISPVDAEYTNNTMLNLIASTNRIIDDLSLSFTILRKNENFRKVSRKIGNTPNSFLKKISEKPDLSKHFKKLFGVNVYENLVRLPKIIKGLENIQARRNKDGDNSYKDFFKELFKLKTKYNFLFDNRLVSVKTEETNYFPY